MDICEIARISKLKLLESEAKMEQGGLDRSSFSEKLFHEMAKIREKESKNGRICEK